MQLAHAGPLAFSLGLAAGLFMFSLISLITALISQVFKVRKKITPSMLSHRDRKILSTGFVVNGLVTVSISISCHVLATCP